MTDWTPAQVIVLFFALIGVCAVGKVIVDRVRDWLTGGEL